MGEGCHWNTLLVWKRSLGLYCTQYCHPYTDPTGKGKPVASEWMRRPQCHIFQLFNLSCPHMSSCTHSLYSSTLITLIHLQAFFRFFFFFKKEYCIVQLSVFAALILKRKWRCVVNQILMKIKSKEYFSFNANTKHLLTTERTSFQCRL